MSNDVIVGTGRYGCSAIKVFKIPGKHNISENSVSFWVHDVYLGLNLVLFKDTEEGKQLSKMIEDEKTLDDIMSFLVDVVLCHVTPDMLKKVIAWALKDQYNQGFKDKATQIRAVLLDDY